MGAKKSNRSEVSDKFTLFPDYIKVESKSGNEYTITLERCTCRGFGFHKTCRHYEQAESAGLIEKLKAKEQEELHFKHSKSTIEIRKDAIRQYLTKNNASFTEPIIDKIESILTSSTTPQEVLSMATLSVSHDIV